MTSALRIANGRVYDPMHPGSGRVRDVLIEDGVVVRAFSDGVEPTLLDAAGRVVMAGGVDMHTHIASTGVQLGRSLDGFAAPSSCVPTTTETAAQYVTMGFTTAMEAAVSPTDAPCAHMQLDDTPILDTGMLVLVDAHDLLIQLLDDDRDQDAAAVVSQLLHLAGAYGMKAVNPAGIAAWRRRATQDEIRSLDDPIRGTSVTARRILDCLLDLGDALNLAHPLHLHCNQLGKPGNIDTLAATLEMVGRRRMHLAHLQFYAYGASADGGYTSAARRAREILDNHANVSADVGTIFFGPAMVVTADTPLDHGLWRAHGSPSRPAVFTSFEQESGLGVMPTSYSKRNRIHGLQWAIGMELLLGGDPNQLCLTVDHPNGGSMTRYPTLIADLMQRDRRNDRLKTLPKFSRTRSPLGEMDLEMSLDDIAVITRAAPAKMLGLGNKGHLGPGADGDVAIYNDRTDDPHAMFASAWRVIKAGQVVAEDGHMTREVTGARLRAAATESTRGRELLAAWTESQGSVAAAQLGVDQTMRNSMRQVTRPV